MKNSSTKKVELLSPAGGMDKLKAAVNNGCDGVYLGGKAFSARAMADNFDAGELEKGIDYAHLRGVKVYVAVNTLYKNSEFPKLLEFCTMVCNMGADGLILQDIGAAGVLRGLGVPLHASTQLTAKTADDAAFLKELGFTRIILSRETSLEEIKKISALGIETEVFVHGALCYCYSGQCLMSSFLGGRSGNRGNCAQPCRLSYELESVARGHLLSPKDMMSVHILQEIIATGVDAIKIEGRLKSAGYTALATAVYRECLDTAAADPEKLKGLCQVFNRGGSFNTGYFKTHSSPGMMSTQTPKGSGLMIGHVTNYIPGLEKCVVSLTDSLVGGDGIEVWTKTPPHAGGSYNSAIPAAAGDTVTITVSGDISKGDKVYKSYDKRLADKLKVMAAQESRKLRLKATVTAVADQRLMLRLTHGEISVEAVGDVVDAAVNAPVTEERLLKQLSKTGGTPFELEFTGAEIGANIYTGIKGLNVLRRNALAEMERRITESYRRNVSISLPPMSAAAAAETRTAVHVYTGEQAAAVISLEKHRPSRLYLECTRGNLESLLSTRDIFAALPFCPWPNEAELLERLCNSGISGFLVRTYGQLYRLRQLGTDKEIALDYGFNVMNSYSLERLLEFAASVCLSPEFEGIPGTGSEKVVCGRLTLMTSNQCPVGLYAAGKGEGMYCGLRHKPGDYKLIDRKGAAYPVIRDCESCSCRILSPPLRLRDYTGFGWARIVFSAESPGECAKLLRTIPPSSKISKQILLDTPYKGEPAAKQW